MNKKEQILKIIDALKEVQFCSPSDDPDQQMAVCIEYKSLLAQLKHSAAKCLPKNIVDCLDTIEVEINNITTVYEANIKMGALLPDIEEAMRNLNESDFKIATDTTQKVEAATKGLSEELWNLRQSISTLAENPFCYPDDDGYSREIIENVVIAQKFAKELFSDCKAPLIKDILILLSKLHRDMELVHKKLGFVRNPPCPDNIYSGEEAKKFTEDINQQAKATLSDLERELPELKEKYYDTLESLAAKFDVLIIESKSNTIPKDQEDSVLKEKYKDRVNATIQNTVHIPEYPFKAGYIESDWGSIDDVTVNPNWLKDLDNVIEQYGEVDFDWYHNSRLKKWMDKWFNQSWNLSDIKALLRRCGITRQEELNELSYYDIQSIIRLKVMEKEQKQDEDPAETEGREAEASTKTPKQQKSKVADKIPISLLSFMETYCRVDKTMDLKSKRDSLLKSKKVTLPKTAKEWVSGQAKVFWAEDLIENWAVYRIEHPNLPLLDPEKQV